MCFKKLTYSILISCSSHSSIWKSLSDLFPKNENFVKLKTDSSPLLAAPTCIATSTIAIYCSFSINPYIFLLMGFGILHRHQNLCQIELKNQDLQDMVEEQLSMNYIYWSHLAVMTLIYFFQSFFKFEALPIYNIATLLILILNLCSKNNFNDIHNLFKNFKYQTILSAISFLIAITVNVSSLFSIPPILIKFLTVAGLFIRVIIALVQLHYELHPKLLTYE